MKYVFLNEENIVVNCIFGNLNSDQRQQFLSEYSILFGATSVVEEGDDVSLYIGGSYDSINKTYTNPIPFSVQIDILNVEENLEKE